MNLLSAEKISKSYSEKKLFEEISFGINEGEKIGLIGINGTGKTTLLKVLAGVEQPDNGRILMNKGLRIEYLPQNPYFEDKETVLQQVFKGSNLNITVDISGSHTIESEAKSILTRLGLNDFDAEVGTLSGGLKKRLAMARALINPADLLILDEPTNHIDNDTVDWLEKFLNRRKGALLMVTHDRYFLDRVVNRIIELENGRLYSYQANYSKFLELKLEREELERSSERKRQNLMRRELEWIKRGAKARSTKQKARIERFEVLQDEQAPVNQGTVEIKTGAARLGKKIIELDKIRKSFPGMDVIADFSYIFLRDDRIGIIGANGAGKSTLLKIISGKLIPDGGRVEVGDTVKIGFFTQDSIDLDENLKIIEYIREEAEFLTTSEGVITASQMLERFLFPPAVQWTPISKLSGGEKRRLYLLRILMGAPNVLLLDEPTNDLDIQTLTVLESYLDDFPGVVIAVSHDRYFLDRIVEKIFSFEENGDIKQYAGNYSDYYEMVQSMQKPAGTLAQKQPEERKNKEGSDKGITAPVKFTYKEQKEYEQIDDIIDGLEKAIADIKNKINDSASDFELLQKLLTEQNQLESKLEEAMERWTYLNELADEIAKNKKS